MGRGEDPEKSVTEGGCEIEGLEEGVDVTGVSEVAEAHSESVDAGHATRGHRCHRAPR